jgi:hypothetical protein
MNRTTRIIVATFGVLLGLSGMNHGVCETLQGNAATGGLLINAIRAGSSWTRWTQGGEGAFTLVPNFLVTGLLAIMVGLIIMIWSVGFVHRRNGPLILLLLFIALFLVGGGIGQIVFFTLVCAGATRINRPLTWWRAALSAKLRRGLAKLWSGLLVLAVLLFLAALEIAIFGFVPGVSDLNLSLYIDWSVLVVGLGVMLLTFVAGFADDIERTALMRPAPSAAE